MSEIVRPGRAVPIDTPWWLAVLHVCLYCECAYRLAAQDTATHHEHIQRGEANRDGLVLIGVIPYIQSGCPCCGRAVATRQPIRFVAASAVQPPKRRA